MILGVAFTYLLCAAGAITFTRLSANVALLWIANAPLLAALLVRPATERHWYLIACFGASVAATLTVSPYAPLAPLLALANVGEPLIAYLLLRRFGVASRPFGSQRSLAIFVACAGVVAPAIAGTLPAVSLLAFQGTPPHVSWSNWIVGHGLGALIGTPVALLLIRGVRIDRAAIDWRVASRGLGVGLLLVATAMACFRQDGLPLLFLPILPLIIATMLFRLAGAAFGVFAIAVIGAACTVAGHGPIQLIASSQAFHLQFFQFYLAALFLTAMPFATMMAERDRLARAVAESQARYRMIAEYASDAVLMLDPAGDVTFASPAVVEISGHAPETLIGRSSFTFVAESDRDRLRELHANAMTQTDRVHRAEFRGVDMGDGVRWFELTARAMTDDHHRASGIVTIVRDLSQRKAREADLERQATTDPMTGVLNRRAFHQRLAELPSDAAGRTGVLALLDLDHFKQINDRFGHAAGDAALLHFADVMRSRLRQEDMIGRLGGEEFAVLFPSLAPQAALAACERVRQTLADSEIVTPHGRFRVTVSIGLSPLYRDMTVEAALRQSDAAMYRAKAAGRNRSELADG